MTTCIWIIYKKCVGTKRRKMYDLVHQIITLQTLKRLYVCWESVTLWEVTNSSTKYITRAVLVFFLNVLLPKETGLFTIYTVHCYRPSSHNLYKTYDSTSTALLQYCAWKMELEVCSFIFCLLYKPAQQLCVQCNIVSATVENHQVHIYINYT